MFAPGLSPEHDLAFGDDAHHKLGIGAEGDGATVSLRPSGAPRQEVVTTDFLTNDDLRPHRDVTAIPKQRSPPVTTPGATASSQKNFVDYDSDVTIPPTLTDLLSNLPNDINADSIQRMLRDSVADRRALLSNFDVLMNRLARDGTAAVDAADDDDRPTATTRSSSNRRPAPRQRKVGDRIDTMQVGEPTIRAQHDDNHQVSWDSQRMRDAPDLAPELPDDGVPRMAGQLLVYDLDETPPVGHESRSGE